MILRNYLRLSWSLPAFVMALGILAPVAQAQMLYTDSSPSPNTITHTFDISPKAPQPPIMKYRLLPSHYELTPGNASQLYHRAILLTSQHTANMENPMEYWQKVDQWRSTPLESFPIDEVETLLNTHNGALREASYAARRSYCDWELPTREHGTDIFGVLLPEIQEMRTLARLLSLRIRLRIAQGRLDEAFEDLQTGYAMARHVGNRDFLVNALVGIAIAGIMHEQLLEAISQESTPNLYWSLVNFPSPVIDIRNAVDVERDGFLIMFPELLEAEQAIGDQVYWDQKLTEVITRTRQLVSASNIGAPHGVKEWEALAYRTAVFSQVPRVKQELVEKMGFDQEEVNAMPGSRAILLYSLNNYKRLRDEFLAPLGLPFYQAVNFYPDDDRLSSNITSGDPIALASLLLPSSVQVQRASVRDQSWVDMLRATEAIRDHAAKHGSLPETLDQVDGLPIPMNPFTNEPFIYTRDENNPSQATLEETQSHLPHRFEITLRQPKSN